ncbi:MAG: GNAT family N-acetyltransferase [Planctomycetota bacterium]|nr:GNAT family N-acetyltransferase [Planctomycetota bacterium]
MIRAATIADAPRIAEIYRPFVEGGTTSFELAAPDPREIAARLERTTAVHPWIVYEEVAESDASIVTGYAYAVPFRARAAYRWCVESSVYVDPAWGGRSIGRSLMEVLMRLLADLGLHEVVAGVTLPNPASVRLHEKLGFEPVGVFPRSGWKDGDWHDVGFWTRSLRSGPPEADPRPWPSHPAAAGGPIAVDG